MSTSHRGRRRDRLALEFLAASMLETRSPRHRSEPPRGTFPPRTATDLLVGDPERRWDDDLRHQGIDRRHDRIEDHLLGTRRDHDLARPVIEPVLATELFDDGLFQFRRPRHRRILRLAGQHRRMRRLDHVRRRLEVGLAGAQCDHIMALGAQFTCTLRGHGARRSGDARHAGGWLDQDGPDGLVQIRIRLPRSAKWSQPVGHPFRRKHVIQGSMIEYDG